MAVANDLKKSLVALDQDSTLIAVVEISQSTWLVAGLVPGVDRQPLKKLAADEAALLQLLYRWRDEATRAGHAIDRIAVAYEAGRDGFWLARWLQRRVSKLMSSTRQVSPCRASIAGRRRIGSIPNC